MDIKLKNRHRLGILIIIAVISSASLIMMACYPLFEKKALENNSQQINQRENLLQDLYLAHFVLYIRAEEQRQGKTINPLKLYFPELDQNVLNVDEYSDELTQKEIEEINFEKSLLNKFYNNYSTWEEILIQITENFQYEILDQNNKVLYSNTEQSLQEQSDSLKNINFNIAFQYNENGNLSIFKREGIDEKEIQYLYSISGNPFKNYYSAEYLYQEKYQFQMPKNITILYIMTPSGEQYYNTIWNTQGYFYDGLVFRATLWVSVFIVIAALGLPFIKGLQIEKGKIYHMPFEIVFVIVMILCASIEGMVSMVYATNERIWVDNLLTIQIFAKNLPESRTIADMIIWIWNFLVWSVVFGCTYWAATCIRPLFTTGLKNYIKKYTLVSAFFGGILKRCQRIYQSFEKIDLQENSNKIIFKIVSLNFVIGTIICCFWFFGIIELIIYSIILFFVLQRYYNDLKRKYQILLKATNEIAKGNLEVPIPEELGVFEPLKEELQKIQVGFKNAVDEEVKSQRMKTDLITNVSHDLKTPLTAIITYVSLLKEESITPEEKRSYIEILEKKSTRLKVLIEDLFEISKATSRNVKLTLMDVDIVSMLKEIRLELADKTEVSGIDFRWNLPDEKIILNLDSQKTYRIFENLLVNITKYAMPGTRAYISLENKETQVEISMKNISAMELSVRPEELTERFVRGDQSRNTEGSGLGLAIAKSFVELQGGKMYIDTEADLFRVKIEFPHKAQKADLEISAESIFESF